MKNKICRPKRPTDANQLAHSVMQDIIKISERKTSRRTPIADSTALKLLVLNQIENEAGLLFLYAKQGNFSVWPAILRIHARLSGCIRLGTKTFSLKNLEHGLCRPVEFVHLRERAVAV
jgi:hypothetical protein